MKLNQIAYYCATTAAADQLKSDLNLHGAPWIVDRVTAKSRVAVMEHRFDEIDINIAELQFCYALEIELEIIRYVSGPHWHMRDRNVIASPCFISHVGIHLDDDEPFPVMPHSQLVQETWTLSHTSDYLTNPTSPGYLRTYHYRIFEMAPGNYVKYIRRIHPTPERVAAAKTKVAA
jgi:hypothetical protein